MCDKNCCCGEDSELDDDCPFYRRNKKYAALIFFLAILAFILFLPLGDPADSYSSGDNNNGFCLRFSCAIQTFMARITTATLDFVSHSVQIIISFFNMFVGDESPCERPCACATIEAENSEKCLKCKHSKDSCFVECPFANLSPTT